MTRSLSLAAAAAILIVTLSGCTSDGTDGAVGEIGLPGLDGTDGTNGTDGTDGTNGTDGTDGENLTIMLGEEPTKVSFSNIAVPTDDVSKNRLQHSLTVDLNGETQTLSFSKLMATGDTDNNEIFGAVKDINDTTLLFDNNNTYICDGTNDAVGSGLDYVSILQKNNKLYMVSQFECQIGAMYMNELTQDAQTGALSAVQGSLKYISQKDDFGGFVHCAGQTTPWQSHLGSEEYENDARFVEDNADASTGLTGNKYYDETAKYWSGDIKKMSPYYYGWTPEVSIDANGTAVYEKHYSMGRLSHELAYVMPDRRTVYMSDDGTNVGLFMYIADKAEDLSEGTIYAAKWNQTSDARGGSADITWIKLGHAKDSDIKTILNADSDVTLNDAPKFSDIFATATPAADKSCATGFKSVNTSAGHECLQVKSGQETAAAFLETRRYAAMMGATTEFRKEEGITFSADHNKLFVAMSQITKGMEDNSSSDVGGNNDIKVAPNSCGGVYAMDVSDSVQKDSNGNPIESSYVVKNMYGLITGVEKTYATGSEYAENTCDVNNIANPDNVSYLEGSNLLFIGEDTGMHENNMVWALDIENGALTRVLATPLGAESTSLYWHNNVNGFGYMTTVTQHPDTTTEDEGHSSVGVLGGIKNLNEIDGRKLVKLASYNSGVEGGSEISAYDTAKNKLFTTNGAKNQVDVIDLTQVNKPTLIHSIDLSTYGDSVQSVSVDSTNGRVAVAVGSANKVTTKGKVVIFSTNDYALHSQTTVGYLPDMVTFNTDGSKVIVANEGEPIATAENYTASNDENVTNVSGEGDYVDVKGSIGVITVASATQANDATGYAEVDFSAATLTDAADGTPVRLGGTPVNDKSYDIEPEYITVNGNNAYVTLQENNAVAKVDISGATPTLTLVKSFGAKDYETANKIDIEEDGVINMKNYPGLKGLYMPDSIASYTHNGDTYLVTANEGDGREYPVDDVTDGPATGDVLLDEKKISKLSLDSSIASAYTVENDLKVVTDMGNTGTDGAYEKLYTYGARSFSIWDADGALVWDSGDSISKLVATYEPKLFNQDDLEKDGRSGNKGAEPEALTVGVIDGLKYAFVGLERQSAILMFDITNPHDVTFVDYLETHTDNDISPEGMVFVPATDSPNGKNLLIVSNEVSGSTVIYEVK